MIVPLEACITANYVKYEKLAPIVAEAFAGSTDTYLDIYIDMNSVIRSLYNSNYNIEINNYKSLTSCIINMCGHYRDYFRRYLGVNTSIYIVMSNNCNEINRKYVAEYNKSFLYKTHTNTMITNLIKDNLELINYLAMYLPNIYLIQSEFETASVISSLIDIRKREGSNNPNLIITRDMMNMQLLYTHNKTAILRPTKFQNQDNSYIIGPFDDSNIQLYWNYFDNVADSKSNKPMENIHPINTPLLMALIGWKKINLNNIFNIKKAKDYIYNCVGDKPVRCSVKTLFEINPELSNKVSWTTVESRYKALDISFQKSLYENSIEYKMINFTDLINPKAVKMVNDKMFFDNPIDLDRL